MDKLFAKFATATARVTGSPIAFLVCVASVVIWAATGPIFHYSETWQLVINTGTTIVTFLMVFLIQNTQNRDGFAIQTKLDELILTSDAEDMFIGIEKLTDKELEILQARCAQTAETHGRIAKHAAAVMSSRRPARRRKARKPAKPA